MNETATCPDCEAVTTCRKAIPVSHNFKSEWDYIGSTEEEIVEMRNYYKDLYSCK